MSSEFSGRLRSYRQGDLAEGIGLELLRRFCAVAPVPRPEDVGIDAVATLLRPERHILVPEQSFFVTVKSKGIFEPGRDGLIYEANRGLWLSRLELPFMLAVVDLKNAKVELYTFHHVMYRLEQQRHSNCPWERLDVRLGYRDGVAGSKNVIMKGTELCVWLGPPVMSFDMGRAGESGFEKWAHSVMSPLLEAERRHMRYVELGIISLIRWETNSGVKPHPIVGHRISVEAPDIERQELDTILPVLRLLYSRANYAGREVESAAYRTILERCVVLEVEGADGALIIPQSDKKS